MTRPTQDALVTVVKLSRLDLRTDYCSVTKVLESRVNRPPPNLDLCHKPIRCRRAHSNNHG